MKHTRVAGVLFWNFHARLLNTGRLLAPNIWRQYLEKITAFKTASPFSVTLDPNEGMPAPSRRNVFFSGTMLSLVCPFMYIYTRASIHTTSIFKTSTEVLSIVLHTSSRNTQSCLVRCLKGKTLLLPCLLYTSPSPRD